MLSQISTELVQQALALSHGGREDIRAYNWPFSRDTDVSMLEGSRFSEEEFINSIKSLGIDEKRRLALILANIPTNTNASFREVALVCVIHHEFEFLEALLQALALARKYYILRESTLELLKKILDNPGELLSSTMIIKNILPRIFFGFTSFEDIFRLLAKTFSESAEFKELLNSSAELQDLVVRVVQANTKIIEATLKRTVHNLGTMANDLRKYSWFLPDSSRPIVQAIENVPYPAFPWFEGKWLLHEQQSQRDISSSITFKAVGRGRAYKIDGYFFSYFNKEKFILKGELINHNEKNVLYSNLSKADTRVPAPATAFFQGNWCTGMYARDTKRFLLTGYHPKVVSSLQLFKEDSSEYVPQKCHLHFKDTILVVPLGNISESLTFEFHFLLHTCRNERITFLQFGGLRLYAELDQDTNETLVTFVQGKVDTENSLAHVSCPLSELHYVQISIASDTASFVCNTHDFILHDCKSSYKGEDKLILGNHGFDGFLFDFRIWKGCKIAENRPNRAQHEETNKLERHYPLSSSYLYGAGFVDIVNNTNICSIVNPSYTHEVDYPYLLDNQYKAFACSVNSTMIFAKGNINFHSESVLLTETCNFWFSDRIMIANGFQCSAVLSSKDIKSFTWYAFLGSFWSLLTDNGSILKDESLRVMVHFIEEVIVNIKVFAFGKELLSSNMMHIPHESRIYFCLKYNSTESKLSISLNSALLIGLHVNLNDSIHEANHMGFLIGIGVNEGDGTLYEFDATAMSMTRESLKTLELHGSVATSEDQNMASKWACPSCTLLNIASANVCAICQTPSPFQRNIVKNAWSCPRCTYENSLAEIVCSMCQFEKPVEEGRFGDHNAKESKQASGLLSHRSDQLSIWMGALPNDRKRPEPLSLPGVWDTYSGLIEFEHVVPKTKPAFIVEGKYCGKSTLNAISTFEDMRWRIRGHWENGYHPLIEDELSKKGVYYFEVFINREECTICGEWMFSNNCKGHLYGSIEGDISCFRGLKPSASEELNFELETRSKRQPFYTGLVNMKSGLTNVCYQNSLIQALFMTNLFRNGLIQYNTENLGNVGKQLRSIFTTLLLSDRPSTMTHKLQLCLPSLWKTGQQHDVSDFHDFLLSALPSSLVQSHFGAETAQVLQCTKCLAEKVSTESSKGLAVPLPTQYKPITSLALFCCDLQKLTKLSIPEWYERIPLNLNEGKPDEPLIYLCISRKVDSPPLTDLVVSNEARSYPGFQPANCYTNLVSRENYHLTRKVYIYYKSDPLGSPITEIRFVKENNLAPDGFKLISTNVNPVESAVTNFPAGQYDTTNTVMAGSNEVRNHSSYKADSIPAIRLCYRLGMPITDVIICATPPKGNYQMIDTPLKITDSPRSQRRHNEDYYLWTSDATGKQPITALKLIEEDKVETHMNDITEICGNVVFAGETGKERYVLLKERGNGSPITLIDIYRAPRTMPPYRYNVTLTLSDEPPIESESEIFSIRSHPWKVVNSGRRTYQKHATNEGEKNRLEPPIGQALNFSTSPLVNTESIALVTGTYRIARPKGNNSAVLNGIVRRDASGLLHFIGRTKISEQKDKWQTCNFTVSNDGILHGHLYSEVAPNPIAAKRITNHVTVDFPIVGISISRDHERIPEGWESIYGFNELMTNSGNLNRDLPLHALYICVLRATEFDDPSKFISNIGVYIPEMEKLQENEYEIIWTGLNGEDANLNFAKEGLEMYLCFQRYRDYAVQDVKLQWKDMGDTIDEGYRAVSYTVSGITDANVCMQGPHQVYICQKLVKPPKGIIPHPINGKYNQLQGEWEFFQIYATQIIEQPRQVYSCDGSLTLKGEGIAQRAQISGFLLYLEAESIKDCLCNPNSEIRKDFAWVYFSLWKYGRNEIDRCCFTLWIFEQDLKRVQVEWALATEISNMCFVKDDYVQLGVVYDSSELWENGKQLFSARCENNSIKSLVDHYFGKSVIDGADMPVCDSDMCRGNKEPHIQSLQIHKEPQNLILTVKRMGFDVISKRPVKFVDATPFSPIILLRKQNRCISYGLYSVIVHKGDNANSGHYYTFARNSSGEGPSRCNSAVSPWIRFNDDQVNEVTWETMTKEIANSNSTTPYLLFYTKIVASNDAEIKMNKREQDLGEVFKLYTRKVLYKKANAVELSMSMRDAIANSEMRNKADLEILSEYLDSKEFHNPTCLEILESNTKYVVGELESRTSTFYNELMIASSFS